MWGRTRAVEDDTIERWDVNCTQHIPKLVQATG